MKQLIKLDAEIIYLIKTFSIGNYIYVNHFSSLYISFNTYTIYTIYFIHVFLHIY